jgi:osmotically-inducible protein OsmY
MKKNVFMVISLIFGLALFSGCATITGETAGEYVDDSTITAQVDATIVKDKDARYLKITVTTTQ